MGPHIRRCQFMVSAYLCRSHIYSTVLLQISEAGVTTLALTTSYPQLAYVYAAYTVPVWLSQRCLLYRLLAGRSFTTVDVPMS
jgi:hypothetical protein